MKLTGHTNQRPSGSKRVLKPALRLLVKNYFQHDVAQNAAALAYYLLFAIFPILIFLNNVLGLLNLNVSEITQVLQKFLPEAVVGLTGSYLNHIAHTSSQSLLWFSLIFSILFPMRAARGLMDDVRLAYGLQRPRNPIAYTVLQLVYTVVLLLVMVLTWLLSALGQQVVGRILSLLSINMLGPSERLLTFWQYLRFLPVGLLMFVALGTLYAVSLDQKQPVRQILPGITAALAAWLVVSIGFSFYAENFANYSVVYGTLGAVIVLLIWLYMTAMILILGAELNAALLAVRSGDAPPDKA